MAALLLLATVAQLLAAPPAAHEVELSEPARAAFEELKDAPPADLLAALDRLGDEGDMSAVEFLGLLYQFGQLGAPHDPPLACALFERAAPERPEAAHNLATCYYMGDGRGRDYVAARHWYLRAAEGGVIKANCALGNMLGEGQGGERDVASGLALCRLASERGDPDAQADLGGYLLLGEVTERDPVGARTWLNRAAERGHANAAFLLGQIHSRGDGTPKDLVAAERWMRVAYEGGRKDAAIYVSQAIFGQIVPDGKTITDRARVPEWREWLEIAATEEPDPARRAQWQDILASLEASD